MSFLRVLGLAALAACLAVRPPFVDAEGIVAYLASVLVAGALTDLVVVPLLRRFRPAADTQASVARLTLRDVLRALGEDGLYYVPLLVAGPNPILALVVATAVATFHFPRYSLRECIWKGLHVFFVAAFVLPYGVSAIALGHLIALAVAHRRWSPALVQPLASRTEAVR